MDLYLNCSLRKSRFPLNLTDRRCKVLIPVLITEIPTALPTASLTTSIMVSSVVGTLKSIRAGSKFGYMEWCTYVRPHEVPFHD